MGSRAVSSEPRVAKGKRSRREVLAGTAGVVGTLIATTLAKAKPAFAGSDGDVVLGLDNQSVDSTTGVEKQFGGIALHGDSSASGGTGVFGFGDFAGISGSGRSFGVDGGLANGAVGAGVRGSVNATNSGDGVLGVADNPTGNAVHGQSSGVNGYAVFGENTGNGVGVLGQTDSSGRSGVWGNNLGGGPGVSGNSAAGIGVLGRADPTTGIGVYGYTLDGIGVWASAGGPMATALKVSGPAVFSRSGMVVIPSGATSAKVKVSGLTPSSLVLATMQNVAGKVTVKAAVPDPGKDKITIYLNSAPVSPASATVAWFILN